MKYLRQLKPVQLKNKICLLRVDFNISAKDAAPVGGQGSASGWEIGEKEAFRIWAVLPTIKFLIKNKAKVVILSHRGRPKTQNYADYTQTNADEFLRQSASSRRESAFSPRESAFSLKPFARILSRLLKKSVHFIDFNIGKSGTSDVSKLMLILRTSDVLNIKNSPSASIFLLENLRFFPEEEKNDQDFAKSLASFGDIFINDAFAVSHRENASVSAITRFLPSYAGLLLEKEIKNLNSVMSGFEKPLVIILGGAKVSDKIGLINNFLGKTKYFLIGGAMANTFFAGQGLPVGDSLYEPKAFPFVHNLRTSDVLRLILPIDLVIHQRKILDIGPETIKKYAEIIKKTKTIIWNGPMGMSEDKRFVQGTKGIAQAVLQNKKAKIVIGGGETVASLTTLMSADYKRITADTYPRKSAKNQRESATLWVSTGGGAMLEYLAGKKLPGLKALDNADMRIQCQ